MKNKNDLNLKIIQIPVVKYDEFCIKLMNQLSITPNFESFKNKENCKLIAQIAADVFFKEINVIISLLNDVNVAISAFDIPESTLYSKDFNDIYGVAVMLGIFNNIGNSSIDRINELPFTIHKALHSNAERLESMGMSGYTPGVKLDFHNDGLLSHEKIEISKTLALYNLYIGYHNPGNFMWVPTKLWHDSEKYSSLSIQNNISVKIKLSPIFHVDKNNDIVSSGPSYVKAPVSNINEEGQLKFFINGQVLREDNDQTHVDFINSILDSLKNNPNKIYIPQKERRAIFLRNSDGFHARDVFEDPVDGIDLSRVLLRSIDIDSELYPSLSLE